MEEEEEAEGIYEELVVNRNLVVEGISGSFSARLKLGIVQRIEMQTIHTFAPLSVENHNVGVIAAYARPSTAGTRRHHALLSHARACFVHCIVVECHFTSPLAESKLQQWVPSMSQKQLAGQVHLGRVN